MLLAPPRQDASSPTSPSAPTAGTLDDAARTPDEQLSVQTPADARARATPGPTELATLSQSLVRQAELADSVRLLLGWLLQEGGASEARLGWYDTGHVRLSAETPSHKQAPTPDATPPTAWVEAMEEALDQGQALCWPPAPGHAAEWVTLAQRALASASGAAGAMNTTSGPGAQGPAVLTLILPGATDPLGALSLRWPSAQAAPSPQDTEAWQAIATQIAPIMAWQRQAGRPWHWHLRQALLRAWRRSRAGMRTHPKRAALLAALALAVLALLPLPERVGGQARIEGAQQRVLAATSDGFIEKVHAQPGDLVKAGQVLADLAQQDLKLEREKWSSQIAQQDNAYAAAMTRADRAEAAQALSRLEEAQAQLALVDEQLQRTQLKAPFDGVLIQGDLSQSVGAPVKQGDTLMTVASTQRWRVIVDIDEADIGHVRIGQEGAIALSALPWDTLPVRVRRITPLAQAKDGRNLFEVEAAFTAPVPPQVRPGLMGHAKLRIGHRPLLWSWLRPLAERVRLGLWSWSG